MSKTTTLAAWCARYSRTSQELLPDMRDMLRTMAADATHEHDTLEAKLREFSEYVSAGPSCHDLRLRAESETKCELSTVTTERNAWRAAHGTFGPQTPAEVVVGAEEAARVSREIAEHENALRAALERELATVKAERDKARSDYQWMVSHQADQRLDGYRELGRRAAEAEERYDAERRRAEVTQHERDEYYAELDDVRAELHEAESRLCTAKAIRLEYERLNDEKLKALEASRAETAAAHKARLIEERLKFEALAELDDVRAELHEADSKLASFGNCGQTTVCATPPGCLRHWEERNLELVSELADALQVQTDLCAKLAAADARIAELESELAANTREFGRLYGEQDKSRADAYQRLETIREGIAEYLEHVASVEVGSVLSPQQRELVGMCSSWVRNQLDEKWAKERGAINGQ